MYLIYFLWSLKQLYSILVFMHLEDNLKNLDLNASDCLYRVPITFRNFA